LHHLERCSYVRRQVDLVDDQQVRSCNTWATLPWNLVTAGDINHIDRNVYQLGTERSGQVIATALHEDQLEAGVTALQIGDRLQVHRRILADGGVRTAARLDTAHAAGGQGALTNQEFGVFFSVNIVGHHGHVDGRPQAPAQRVDQRGFPASHRTSHAHAKCSIHAFLQNKKYLCVIGSASAGSHVNSSPSARTSYVSGSTSILGVAELWIMSALPMARQFSTAQIVFARRSVCDKCRSMAAFETNVNAVSSRARPNEPNMGQYRTGCGVGIDAFGSPIALQAMKPPFTIISGLTPKKAGFHKTRSASLPGSIEPTCAEIPWVIAGLIVYLATKRFTRKLSLRLESCASGPRWTFILCAVCQVRRTTSPMRP